MTALQTLIFGLVTASYLIVATLGFALVSRTEKFLNIAHAELILASAFVTYYLSVRQGWPLAGAALAAVVGMAVVSLVARLLVDLRDVGMTILVVEHNLGFVMPLVSTVAVMDCGRVIRTGPPQEIQQDPAVIAAYLGGGEP